MDWIKINTSLPRSPKVRRLASLMGVDKHTALGLVLDWLCWVDSATADGCTGLSVDEINAEFACNANCVTPCNAQQLLYCNALIEIGWAELDENGLVCVHNFEAHNGDNAKRRAQSAKRVAVKRSKVCNAKSVTPCNAPSVTREEKRREDNNKHPKGALNTLCGGATAEPGPSMANKIPETSDEVLFYLSSLANCGLKGDELMTCAEAFFNQSEAVGWTLNGQPVRDWRASARAYLARWQGNIASRAAAAPRGGKITYRSETQQNYEL